MRVDLSSVEQESLLARAEQAEAAIARVLELCDESDQNRPRIDVLRALDGEQ